VVAVEEDKEGANGGWQEQKPILGEDIRVQQSTTVADSDSVLMFLIVSVQRCQVDVGGSFVDVDIVMRGTEDTEQERSENETLQRDKEVYRRVDHKRSEGEHQGRQPCGVFNKLVSGVSSSA
jgi:hypothetical protein